jgi:hypothetical protein
MHHFGAAEQPEAWPLPQGWPHSAHTQFGSGGSEEYSLGVATVSPAIASTEKTSAEAAVRVSIFFFDFAISPLLLNKLQTTRESAAP